MIRNKTDHGPCVNTVPHDQSTLKSLNRNHLIVTCIIGSDIPELHKGTSGNFFRH